MPVRPSLDPLRQPPSRNNTLAWLRRPPCLPFVREETPHLRERILHASPRVFTQGPALLQRTALRASPQVGRQVRPIFSLGGRLRLHVVPEDVAVVDPLPLGLAPGDGAAGALGRGY